MFKLTRKALPMLFAALMLILGAWNSGPGTPTVTPSAGQAGGGQSGSSASQSGSAVMPVKLSGQLGKIPGIQERVQAISSFQMNLDAVSTTNVSEFDKQFVEDSLTSNTLELMTMEYVRGRVKNSELRSLVDMMIVMHSKDQETIKALATKLGVDMTVDLTKASVYPGTPAYDLGQRTENLQEKFLTPLKEVRGVPFDLVAVRVLEEEHSDDVQAELTARGVMQNTEMLAFSQHAADVTALHMMLLDDLHDRLSLGHAQKPDFQEQYVMPSAQNPQSIFSSSTQNTGANNGGASNGGANSSGANNSGANSSGSNSGAGTSTATPGSSNNGGSGSSK